VLGVIFLNKKKHCIIVFIVAHYLYPKCGHIIPYDYKKLINFNVSNNKSQRA